MAATPLHEQRLERVFQTLLKSKAESVLDLGCGTGELLIRLVEQRQFKRIIGIDSSVEALGVARELLGMGGWRLDDKRLLLYHESLTTFVEDFVGIDVAVMIEVIEHIDPRRLSAIEQTVFAGYRPRLVLVTTPNREYNVLHGTPEDDFRHRDHRFEWPRSKFRKWADGVAGRNGYQLLFDDIGPADPTLGSSTQMATFCRA